MGDQRQPEIPNQPQENSSGLERATSMMLDQFLRGDFNLGRNARPLLTEAAQLNPLTLTDDQQRSELSLRTNLFSLSTRMEYQSPGIHALFNFMPATGWNNPFRRPTYNLEAQTADRSTMLSVNSRDGAAPNIQFGHNRDGVGISYLRNPTTNEFRFTADHGSVLPVRLDIGHDFRGHQTRLGLSRQFSPYAEFGLGATMGRRNYYDLGFHLRIGARSPEHPER